MTGMALAWRLARRELRGGLAGFRIFLACLALGVAVIAAVGSLAAGVRASLEDNARELLGGDLEISFSQREANAVQLAALASYGDVSLVAEMRGMARGAEERALIELKAVDRAYPLLGNLTLTGAPDIAAALAQRDGVWGAAVEPAMLTRLAAKLGDRIKIGEQDYELRAVVDSEPDRATNAFTLGPRVMVAYDSLAATGLKQPGSLIRYEYRLALLQGVDAVAAAAQLRADFPDAGWRIRTPADGSPGVRQWIDRIAMFLTLVGLTALLVGGVGVANAVRSYIDGKTATIATLKCLGAEGRLVMSVYLILVAVMAAAGIAIGLIVGAAAPIAVAPLLVGVLPVSADLGFYPQPLALAAAFGVLTATAFSLWPLARAREVPPAALFRDLVAPARRWPRRIYIAIVAASIALLGLLSVYASVDRALGAWFVVGAIGAFAVFRGAGWLIATLARHAPHVGRPGLRLALANLHRPGNQAAGLVLSLGLGLTVLVLIALTQGNLVRQLREQLPDVAPTFFFVDIQPDQVAAFDALLASAPGMGVVRRVPSLRGRIVRLKRAPVENATVAPEAQWAVGSDRGITYSATPPSGSRVVAGEWWPPDYSGPPLVSFDTQLARGMGLTVGDTITVNLLGREIEATIANLRAIDWTSLGINFTLVFAPGTLEGAPQTHIATAQVAPGYEAAVERDIARQFPNISTIRIKDALALVETILGQIAAAARITAAVTLLAGTLVLAGAVFAAHRRRVYDAVVFKVLGARRSAIIGAFALEFALIGLSSVLVAVVIGALSSWLLLTRYMQIDFSLLPGTLALTVIGAAVTVALLGLAGTWRALGQKPAPLLRNA